MMKRLSSFVLLIMIALPFYVQAADITAPVPTYQVDVTHSAVAANAVKPVEAVKPVQRIQSVANITLEPAEILTRVSQYNSHKSITAAGIIGVSGGDSIGIRRS